MDYFIMTKHRTVEENVLYNAKILYKCLTRDMHVDELFTEYYEFQSKEISINMEELLFKSITLLFSLGLITLSENVIKKVSF